MFFRVLLQPYGVVSLYGSREVKMRLSDYIKKCIREGTQISRFNVTWGVLLAAPGHIFFYLLLKYGFNMPYENFPLRFSASLIALFSFVLVRMESPLARKYFPFYWHFSLIYILPFLFTLFLLKNDFHELWLYWEIFMVFILIAFVPNWLMLLFDLFVGVIAGIAWYVLTTPEISLNPDFDIPAYLTVLIFSVIAGYLFSYSNRRGQAAMEKNSAFQALAGSIAHEMRNPLNQVSLNLEIIERKLPVFKHQNSPSTDIQALDSLYQHVAWCRIAIKRGTQIIAMILDEVREKPIDKSSFSYAPAALITQKAIDEYGFESIAEKEKIILDNSSDFMFRISETMYVFVIFNLIKNALYYLESRPDARIYIGFQTGERYNSVKIRDTGPGISPENLSRLFDPYFTASKKGGTGLGLSYCKRVMHAFDGDIVCHSVEGRYTEFILTFPVVTCDELKASHDKLIQDNSQLFNKKSILVVDDNEKDRKIVKDVLVNLDVAVDEAANGQEALEKIRIASYDLVIMNLAMPLLDGYEATEMIRSGHVGQEAAGIPIIGYTEQPYAVVRGKTNKVGMQELITKPLMESDLVMKISAVFREYHGISLQKIGGKSVLIADDSAVNRIGLIMVLEKYGIKAEGAINGKDALEKLEKGRFDLVLMDIGMPQVNGIEATMLIRKSSIAKVAEVPVIGFSGESDEQLIRDALAAGMIDYMVKPVDIRLLLEKISQTL